MAGIGNQEIYHNKGDASGKNTPKCTVVTKWAGEFFMVTLKTMDNPRLKGLNKGLPCNK